jgi:hypothetical protein
MPPQSDWPYTAICLPCTVQVAVSTNKRISYLIHIIVSIIVSTCNTSVVLAVFLITVLVVLPKPLLLCYWQYRCCLHCCGYCSAIKTCAVAVVSVLAMLALLNVIATATVYNVDTLL